MSEDNKALARRFLEVFSEGNVDALDEFVAPDVVLHDPQDPFAGEGLEGTKKSISMYREAFPDLKFELEFQVAEGDYVATRWVGTGTHEGELMGMEPTHKQSSVTGIGIDRIEDGKIVEAWNEFDFMGMYRQLGALTLNLQ